MKRYLHHSNTGSCELLSAELRLPVILPDSDLHRRSTVHFLYLVDCPHPLCFRHITLAFEQAAADDATEVALVHFASEHGITYNLLALRPTTEGTPNG